jgi:hypothetical protein
MSDQPYPANGQSAPGAGGYARINGLSMYYERHGSGEPLVLLQGALSATETSFGALRPRADLLLSMITRFLDAPRPPPTEPLTHRVLKDHR